MHLEFVLVYYLRCCCNLTFSCSVSLGSPKPFIYWNTLSPTDSKCQLHRCYYHWRLINRGARSILLFICVWSRPFCFYYLSSYRRFTIPDLTLQKCPSILFFYWKEQAELHSEQYYTNIYHRNQMLSPGEEPTTQGNGLWSWIRKLPFLTRCVSNIHP